MSMKENSRQHGHRAVRYCSNQINRETFIKGSPAFFSDQLLGRIDDPPLRMLFDHPIRGHIVRQWSSLCLKPCADHFVWVGRNGGGHLRDGRANEDSLGC